jgi:hypothetical protein
MTPWDRFDEAVEWYQLRNGMEAKRNGPDASKKAFLFILIWDRLT